MLVDLTEHHLAAWLFLLCCLKVFKKEQLLLLLHAALNGCIVRQLLLCQLVFGGHRFAELGQSVVVVVYEALGRLYDFAVFSVEANHAQVAICVRSRAYLFEEAAKSVTIVSSKEFLPGLDLFIRRASCCKLLMVALAVKDVD